jgi:soluble lytic murein transglycosylase-like protein
MHMTHTGTSPGWWHTGAWSLALLFLFITPAVLIGEEFQAKALKNHRMAKIESLLVSQDASEEIAAELARGILHESEKNSVDPLLVVAVIQVESRFDHRAKSSRGARGLMQIQPVVVAELIEEGKISPQGNRNLNDPIVNLRVGVSYLAYLKEMFGDVRVALAAYNWGPARIRQMIAAKEKIPSEYATKVLTVQRSLEDQMALNHAVPRQLDSSEAEAAG